MRGPTLLLSTLTLALAALVAPARGVSAQGSSAQAAPQPAPVVGPGPAAQATATALSPLVDKVRQDPTALPLPPSDSIRVGGLVVPAGATVGRIAISGGTLEVFGTVTGDAIAIDGQVVVRPGGHVLGNAFVAKGQVTVDSGGRVDGEVRTIGGDVGAFPGLARGDVEAARPRTTAGAVQLVLASLAVLIVLGIGVLVMAGEYLDGVLVTLERSVGRALLVGLGAQLAIVPVLVVLIVALAITIIGLLLIPFAVVAYCIAVAGLLTLGFLAAALLTGHAMSGRKAATARATSLKALLVGVAIYLGLWLVAAAFTWSPIAGALLRGLAFAITWVVATAGFGASILSRAGTRRATARVAPRTLPADDFAWQTPTPVTGVAAARRPTPAPPPRNPAA
jgi:hypothetical protein